MHIDITNHNEMMTSTSNKSVKGVTIKRNKNEQIRKKKINWKLIKKIVYVEEIHLI